MPAFFGKSAGQTVKGAHGGSIRVVDVVKQDGTLRIKVQVETAGRGLSDAPVLPFGGTIIINGKRLGEEEYLSSQNFALVDGLQRVDGLDQRGLSRAGRTTDDHDLSLGDPGSAVGEHLEGPVVLGDVVDLDHEEILC